MYEPKTLEFDAIRLTLASPEVMRAWSRGEVTKPETINYRTQKPEKYGLFCEMIFGPTKDWECYCGKYKKLRYKGIVCDKCGVEVTHSLVRRERMGHIELATSVSHIWFLRSVPSKIGLVLDLGVQTIEKVVYFANFIITEVNEELRRETLEQVKREYKGKRKQIEGDTAQAAQRLTAKEGADPEATAAAIRDLEGERDRKLAVLEEDFHIAEEELKELRPLAVISEQQYQELSLKYGHIFNAGIGAAAIRQLLERIDIPKTMEALQEELVDAQGQKRERLLRRLKLLRALHLNHIRPEWMVMTVVPVIPPDLRPMVALDGGRFATSDLNDLYRRVINRNNRLKRLIELNAPEVISRNERRMLQEAVDALIDNSARQSKTVMAATGQKRQLKSLADQLKGKQGRFRQNLLGKRIDYSGRSVIVVGPELALGECGIPKRMALELFKPFVISKLIARGFAHNIRGANRVIESDRSEVWDILEEITKDSHVLLNRAPTLHRLGIQAFRPKLIEGKAIQIHPLVCTAYNADFDGDQMAVHLPITESARKEAAELMLASNNLLKPATGSPIVTPNKDIAWGCYLLTMVEERKADAPWRYFSSPDEAFLAYQMRQVGLRDLIRVRFPKLEQHPLWPTGIVETTVGRIVFHRILPEQIPYRNDTVNSSTLVDIVRLTLELYGRERTAALVDAVKRLGFYYAMKTAYSWGMSDLPTLPNKHAILDEAQAQVDEIEQQYADGLLTDEERHAQIIQVWTESKEKIVRHSKEVLDPKGPIATMIDSGARGSWTQLTQMVGMKGLVTNPAGEIIELPVKGSFKEGLDVIEYFISTHGARKGLTDTALKTANAGYLTRRLVDVAQDVVVHEHDCGDTTGWMITAADSKVIGVPLLARAIGRIAAADVVHPTTGEVVVPAGEYFLPAHARVIGDAPLASIRLRSALTCRLHRGICQRCYGWDLAYNREVSIGTAVGIIAAQSIGEPGTQLTMRTFHTGGVAAGLDITQGLPRVEELFEARAPKRKAFVAEAAGIVRIDAREKVIEDATGKSILKGASGQKIVSLTYMGAEEERMPFAREEGKPALTPRVSDGDRVTVGQVLLKFNRDEVTAPADGVVRVKEDHLIFERPVEKVKEVIVPPGYVLWVRDGDQVTRGQQLTDGAVDPHELYGIAGKEGVARYMLTEVQTIYTSQGQKLNDKHIETIVRQLFSRVMVNDSGETNLLPGETVERAEFEEANAIALAEGRQPGTGEDLFLGISRVSLSTRSFLSAASFQETAKVLINAAVTGKVDRLDGLKENVIIGRLIPAGTGFRPYRLRSHERYDVVPLGEMAKPEGIEGARKW
ncbi:DNA-directed RNA polymerase subunit beta' [Candidatus Uhrbacteria bacterium]|nr:DNA-directed RNA polymerase subunit beta' [Candidatus Uhrbacteria bacterium]